MMYSFPDALLRLLVSLIINCFLAVSISPSATSFVILGQRKKDKKADGSSKRRIVLRPLPTVLLGVTLEGVSNLPEGEQIDVNDAVSHHRIKPISRIVFDYENKPEDYLEVGSQLHQHSFIMGEILDSASLKECNLTCYSERTRSYLDQLGNKVDIWEIGNEVNGEWTGSSTTETVKKIEAACKLVKDRGGRTALTLYYNSTCPPPDRKYEMWQWINDHHRVLSGMKLDYVLVSYYEDHCGGPAPDWVAIFKQLARYFPNSSLGIGECGMIDESGECVPGNISEKTRRINNYYKTIHSRLMTSEVRTKYAGGYFWWCYRKDMVPRLGQGELNPLWKAVEDATRDWR